MPEFIGGLPLHPLIVHFVVVLLPVAVLGSILTAIWPWVRKRFGWLAVAAAAVGTILAPIATNSGTKLEARIGTNSGIERHAELGNLMVWWALALFVAVTALMVLHTMAERRAAAEVEAEPADEPADGGVAVATATRKATSQTVAMLVAIVATVGLAVGTGIHVYRVGDAGARLVWDFVEKNPPANGG
ncbi:MAG: hypothetical protein GEV28_09485 [Actinophytocola sp.]|uniref:DUF2231 domain-containing protein n=1 Tax=Actinophytocola sp. TaxID=1872138 RepID=UPI001326ED27|nr:DUF2231 domain-containing protein [Actinophytocola sp.]MPZ80603.1 hypothetical protein [Actinophytocola sp.]